MTMVIVVNNAQSNRIETMLTDDFKSNGLTYLFKLKNFINEMLVEGINDAIKERYYNEINLVSDIKLIDLFNDIDEISFCNMQHLVNYIKKKYNLEVVTVGHLLYLDYSELIRDEYISLDILELITSKFEQIKIEREFVKQKTKQFA